MVIFDFLNAHPTLFELNVTSSALLFPTPVKSSVIERYKFSLLCQVPLSL